MQILIEILSGLIAMIAAAALSQIGMNVDAPKPADREVTRVQNCQNAPSTSVKIESPKEC